MGTKYTTTLVSGYNSSPPPDDGSQVAANKITWSGIKTKLGDPLNTFDGVLNTALLAAFDTSATAKSSNYTTVAADNVKTLECTNTITISLGDATTMTAGYSTNVYNAGTGIVSVTVATVGNKINGTAGATIALIPGALATFAVNAAVDGYNYNFYSVFTTNANSRQTVLGGPVDSAGLPTFLPSTSVNLNLTSQNITSSAPFVVAAANGFNVSGANDRVGQSIANLTWTGLTASQTNYLYVTVNADGTLTTGFTILAPAYQWGGTYSVTNGQSTYNIQEAMMKVGSGSAAAQAYIVFVGEAVTSGSAVTSTVSYAYRRQYIGAFTATFPNAATAISANHNLGITDTLARFTMECTTTDAGYSVGDRITLLMRYGDGAVMDIWSTRNSCGFTTSDVGAPGITHKSTGTLTNITKADWKYRLEVIGDWQ